MTYNYRTSMPYTFGMSIDLGSLHFLMTFNVASLSLAMAFVATSFYFAHHLHGLENLGHVAITYV